MTTRLAVLGLHHEANTFSSVLATLGAYRSGGWHRGPSMVDRYRDSKSTVAGYLQPGPGEVEVETLALPVGMVTPCGPISAEAYRVLGAELIEALRTAGRIDAVLLVLHGAAIAEGNLHVDADLAELVRAEVGPSVPIGTVVDMHANLDRRLVDAVDVLLAYQTNPHVDAREVGAECRRRTLEVLSTGNRPAIVLEQLPLVVTIVKQDTSSEPLASLLAAARGAEMEPGIEDVSILEGFPYADAPQMGMSVLVTHQDSAEIARATARRIALAVWDARSELQGGAVPLAEAVGILAAHEGPAPLLVLDVGDNIGGGGPGDSTILLAELLRRRVTGAGTTLLDADAVSSVARVPVGGRVAIAAGGRSPEQDGAPVLLAGVVVGRHEGRYEEAVIAHGGFRTFDGGAMVAIRTDEGPIVILTSRAVQPVSPEQYRVVGVDPAALRTVVAKGVNGPRVGFASICDGLVVVDTPGVTRNSIVEFAYRHRRTPMYPYEQDTRYPG